LLTGDAAVKACDLAILEDPKYANAYNNRGLEYEHKGNSERAIANYTEAIDKRPEYPSAYYNRGIAYKAKGDLDRAVADFTKAIEIDPEFALAYYNRGLVYQAKGDFDRSLADYGEAIRLDGAALAQNPKDAGSLYGRGMAKLKSGDTVGGRVDIAAAMAIKPDIDKVYAGYGTM
jgi:tetratricopeptide (TPR) repeat protein